MTRPSRWSRPEAAAREIVAACRRRRHGRHPVRPRALRPAERGGRARQPHHHLSGQSRLCLAQPGAGGAADRLRMVQALDRRRAAVRDARALRAAPRSTRCRRSSTIWCANSTRSNSCARREKRETMLVNLRNIFTRMDPTKQDMHTLHGVVMAIAEGRKGPAKGGVLDGEQATRLRALLAEHGQGRAAVGERHGARAGAAVAAKPDRRRAHPVAGADHRPPLRRPVQAPDPGRPPHSRISSPSCTGSRSSWSIPTRPR